MSQENRCWGARRIQGELRALGYEVSAETVRRYRLQARRRPPSQRWQAFLANHRNEIWAADFFTVATVLFQTLYVLFFISHDRRRIEHINVTAHPNAACVWRQVIEATPWGRGPRFLIRDRDRSYGGDFIAKARAIGIETVLTPIRAPQANGIAERLIGTLRRDCTNHIIPLSERHLRRVLLEYVAYYNATRPHQTLGQETPEGPREVRLAGMVRGEEVLGGIHHRYERVAAKRSEFCGRTGTHRHDRLRSRAAATPCSNPRVCGSGAGHSIPVWITSTRIAFCGPTGLQGGKERTDGRLGNVAGQLDSAGDARARAASTRSLLASRSAGAKRSPNNRPAKKTAKTASAIASFTKKTEALANNQGGARCSRRADAQTHKTRRTPGGHLERGQ